jgi:hypothetical protein
MVQVGLNTDPAQTALDLEDGIRRPLSDR